MSFPIRLMPSVAFFLPHFLVLNAALCSFKTKRSFVSVICIQRSCYRQFLNQRGSILITFHHFNTALEKKKATKNNSIFPVYVLSPSQSLHSISFSLVVHAELPEIYGKPCQKENCLCADFGRLWSWTNLSGVLTSHHPWSRAKSPRKILTNNCTSELLFFLPCPFSTDKLLFHASFLFLRWIHWSSFHPFCIFFSSPSGFLSFNMIFYDASIVIHCKLQKFNV